MHIVNDFETRLYFAFPIIFCTENTHHKLFCAYQQFVSVSQESSGNYFIPCHLPFPMNSISEICCGISVLF